MRSIWLLAALSLAALALAGCGSTCGPTNCSGCCDGNNQCQIPSTQTCGLGGAACASCVGAQKCVGGVCENPGGTGSGNGNNTGSGNGSANGSGSTSATTSTSTTGTTGTTNTTGFTTGGSSTGTTSVVTTGSTGTTTSSTGTTGIPSLSPNVILVVDRSNSMADSADGTQTGVCTGAGQENLNCKWDEVLTALSNSIDGFVGEVASLGSGSDPVRVGLVTFSGSTTTTTAAASCVPGVLQVAPAPNTVTSINNALAAIAPLGGTPTASSLGVAGQAFNGVVETGRANYVVLITDGAPNCDASFAATTANCEDGTGYCTSPGACVSSSGTNESAAPYGCLDEDATVAMVQNLAQAGIETFVIGIGADFANASSPTVDTLNQCALAGGLPRMDSSGNVLSPAFYQASDIGSLQSALSDVLSRIQ